MRRVFFAIFLTLIFSTSALSATYYFSTSGSDLNEGSKINPKKSLSHATSLMSAGTIIKLNRGDTWIDDWTIKGKHGTISQPIIVEPYGSGEKPNISGRIELKNVKNIKLNNLLSTGNSYSRVMIFAPTENITFDSWDFIDCKKHGLRFRVKDKTSLERHINPVVSNSTIIKRWKKEWNSKKEPGGDGIDYEDGVEGGKIINNKIIDFGHTGIRLASVWPDQYGVHNVLVEGNEVKAEAVNYLRAFELNGAAGQVTNNTVRRNLLNDLRQSSKFKGDNNKYYSNIIVNHQRPTTSTNNVPYAIEITSYTQRDSHEKLGANNNIIANNTFYDVDGSGIKINGKAIKKNYFYNNVITKFGTGPDGGYGIDIRFPSESQIVENNCLWNQSSSDEVFRQSGVKYTSRIANKLLFNFANNIQQDPLFTDPENRDFSLQKGSPCIHKGKSIADLIGPDFVDYYGKPFSDPPSIGAIEY